MVFFLWRTIFTFPAYIERLQRQERVVECVFENGEKHANELLFIVNISPVREVFFYLYAQYFDDIFSYSLADL